MPAHLLKCRLDLPTPRKPREDLPWIGLKVGTEESLGFELFLQITYQHPAHRYREQARAVPHGRLGSNFNHALPAPIPGLAIVVGFQTVFGSSATTERLGSRSPLR